MPILIEAVSTPSEQDWIDLIKIRQDDPDSSDESPEAARAAIASRLAGGDALYGARFNARLIGSLWLTGTGPQKTIDHLCVRKITRRRGVGHKLLKDLSQLATTEGWSLTARANDSVCAAVFSKSGFVPAGEAWSFNA